MLMVRGVPEETKARIVKAASGLFYAHGIRATGVDAIAEKAGVTKRTLYRHFASKDQLVAAYLETRNEPLLAALVQSVLATEGDLEAQIAGLFMTIGEQAGNPSWHGCPFARAVSELRQDDSGIVAKIAANHKCAFEDWLENYFACREVAEPRLLARQLMILVDGAITQLLIHRDASYATVAYEAAVLLIQAERPKKGECTLRQPVY